MNQSCQTTNSELYHHGILGQKWGVRRFQNRDGSLTTAGRKRLGIKDSKEKNKSKNKSESSKKKSKSVKDMTDDELRSNINRLQMEKQYLDLNKQVSQLSPREMTSGEKFVKGLEETFVPAVKNAGKNLTQQWLEKKGKELLGLKSEDSVEALKKEAQALNYKKQINEAKKYFEAEKNNSRSNERNTTATNNSNNSSSTNAQTGSNSTNRQTNSNGSSTSSTSNRRTRSTVEGEGTSRSNYANQNHRQQGPVHDVDFTEVTPTSRTANSSIELGERYIAGLLEDRRR